MKIEVKVLASGIAICLGLLSLANPFAIAAPAVTSPTLGLSVSVLPEANGEVSPIQAGLINSLALTIEPGKSAIRRIRIQSAAPNSEVVSTSIGYASLVNSVLTLDDQKESHIAPWIKMDKPVVTLESKKTVDISLTISVPEGEPIGIREAYLLVTAKLPKDMTPSVAAKQGAARYAIPIYVGVGTTTQILTDFQVGLVTLTKVANDEAFLIPIVNIGMTPVLPVGFLVLKSVLGQLIFAAQIPFQSSVIQAGGSFNATVPIPDEVPDGVWNVHAEAHDGTLVATSDSIVTIKRIGLAGDDFLNLYRTALGVVSLLLFIFVLLYIKRGKKDYERV